MAFAPGCAERREGTSGRGQDLHIQLVEAPPHLVAAHGHLLVSAHGHLHVPPQDTDAPLDVAHDVVQGGLRSLF